MLAIGGGGSGGSSGSATYSDEQVRDVIGDALVAGANVAIAVDDAANTITISATIPAGYSDEQAQDAFAALISAGSHSGIVFAYDDNGNSLSATVSPQMWSQIVNKPAFSAVSTSGSYTDLTNKPSIVAPTRTITAGTGLTGGGDLSADRSFSVNFGTSAGTAAQGNDGRLTDQRTPTDGSVTDAKVAAGAAIGEAKLNLASDAAAGTASRRTIGSGATQAAAGNHTHDSTYAPVAHTHGVTALTATGTRDATTFLRGDNTWAPAGNLTPTTPKTAAYTAVSGDLVMVDATNGPITVTLPSATSGRIVGVKKLDSSANVVAVQRAGSDTIGSESAVSIPIKTNDQATHFLANGANWVIPYNHLSLAALDLRFPPATTVAATTRTVSANTTAVVGETLWVSASGGSRIVTAPVSTTAGARVLLFKSDTSTNTVSWDGTINGDTGGAVLYQAGSGVGLVFDGTAWWVEYTSTVGASRTGGGTAPVSAGVRQGFYDQHRNVYSPGPAARRALRGHLGRAATGALVDMVCAGDSRTAGTANGPALSWPSQLRARLAATGIPSAGTGLVMAGQGSGLVDARVATTGTWMNPQPGIYRVWGATGSTATFAPDASGTIVEVYYALGSGAFTVSINGGSAAPVTPAAGSGVAKWTSPTQGSAITSVLLTTTSASGSLVGFCVRGTSGLLIHNVSVSGFGTNNWVTTTAGSIQTIATLIAPSIFGLQLGDNDHAASVSPATFSSQLATILATNNPNAAKFMLAETAYNTTLAPGWPAYVSAIYDQADLLGFPILDLNDRYGGPAEGQTAGLLGSDQLHESIAGCADTARAAAHLLTA